MTLIKQKEIFEEAAKKRIDEIQNLNKQIQFNSLDYYFKGESGPKNSIDFRGSLGLYGNIKKLYNTRKVRRKSKVIKWDLNEIVKGK